MMIEVIDDIRIDNILKQHIPAKIVLPPASGICVTY